MELFVCLQALPTKTQTGYWKKKKAHLHSSENDIQPRYPRLQAWYGDIPRDFFERAKDGYEA